MNAVDKGKGKGKGTQCYNCGGFGHIAVNCRKGKGKGKGNYKGGGRVTYGQYTKGKSYGKKATAEVTARTATAEVKDKARGAKEATYH